MGETISLPATDTVPIGIRLRNLTRHVDGRGSLVELFREEWGTGVSPVQWNVTCSVPGTLRGVHVHIRHADYLMVVTGRAGIAFHDLRRSSPTRGMAGVVELKGETPRVMTIPVGVAHGFYFYEQTTMIYGVSEYWDPADELGCRWDDPDLGIPWPDKSPILSARDAAAPSLSGLRRQLEPWQPL
jgi:dTDP-4-dehydrorhamnose 3,5-epimerase